MRFDPAEFASLGHGLAGSGGFHAEARTRTSLGRSYYGLFLAVRASIREARGRSVDEELGHGELTNALFSSRSEPLIALGTVLNDLYSARQKADYKLSPEGSWAKKLADPQYAQLRARQALNALQKLPSLDLRPILDKV